MDLIEIIVAERRRGKLARGLTIGDRELAVPINLALTPIERYAAWHGDDGLPFDPRLRAHVCLGGVVLRCEARSMEITAPVGDWETRTAMAFPEDGEYVFPRGLAPLSVVGGTGTYWEPNVWVRHEV